MSRCGSCDSAISRKPSIPCSSFCKRLFHIACIGVTPEVQQALTTVSGLYWKCEDCHKDNTDNVVEFLENKTQDMLKTLSESFENMKHDFRIIAENQLQVIKNVAAPTYSEKLRSNPSVVIKPKNPNQPNKNTKADILQNIDPLNSNIKINNVKHIKNGGIVVGCCSKEDSQEFKKLADKKLTNYDVHETKTWLPRIRVVGLSEKFENQQVTDYIIKQNSDIFKSNSTCKVLDIKPIKKKNDVYQALLQVDVESYTNILKCGHLIVGFDSCTVYDAVDVPRCYKCNGFYHNANNCKKLNYTCPRCSDTHKLEECKSANLKCINCCNLKENANVNVCHAVWDYDNCMAYKNTITKLKCDVFGIQ